MEVVDLFANLGISVMSFFLATGWLFILVPLLIFIFGPFLVLSFLMLRTSHKLMKQTAVRLWSPIINLGDEYFLPPAEQVLLSFERGVAVCSCRSDRHVGSSYRVVFSSPYGNYFMNQNFLSGSSLEEQVLKKIFHTTLFAGEREAGYSPSWKNSLPLKCRLCTQRKRLCAKLQATLEQSDPPKAS